MYGDSIKAAPVHYPWVGPLSLTPWGCMWGRSLSPCKGGGSAQGSGLDRTPHTNLVTVGLGDGRALGLGPPCPPYFRPLACDVHPVIYEEVGGDHGLVSGQHHLLQEVRAKVLLHPGILEQEQAKGRGP